MPGQRQAQHTGAENDALTRRQPTESTEPISLAFQNPPTAVVQRARVDPNSLTPSDVLQLQRTIGNRATSRLLAGRTQPDAVRREETPVSPLLPDRQSIRRALDHPPGADGRDAAVLRRSHPVPVRSAPALGGQQGKELQLQPRLMVGPVGDREADRVAGQVVQGSRGAREQGSGLQRQEVEEEELQMKPAQRVRRRGTEEVVQRAWEEIAGRHK